MTPVDAAMECVGTPFKHQARLPGLGLDCAGVLVHIFKSMGLPFNDEMGYPRTPYDGQLEYILDNQPSLMRIDTSEAGEGDVLVMRIRKAPQHILIHAGYLRGQPYVIHGSEEHGKVVYHRIDQLVGSRVVRAYRIGAQE